MSGERFPTQSCRQHETYRDYCDECRYHARSSDRPRLLDLFCGAGGAAMGYHRAGFDVVGVDIDPQEDYPFEFVCDDALDYLRDFYYDRAVPPFDAIHASPPCQAYSAGARMRTGTAKDHPRLIEPVRNLLIETGLPYVIENVPEAPLRSPMRLCGSQFGLAVRRHRAFESNVLLLSNGCTHGYQDIVVGVYGDHPEDSVIRKGHPAVRARDIAHAQEAMGIYWTSSWHSLKEAIPPAYTQFIGEQLLSHLQSGVRGVRLGSWLASRQLPSLPRMHGCARTCNRRKGRRSEWP
jgi:DNA (cytosine-5)-methyltransferase 1